MKVLLVLAAVGVLGGNAYPPPPGVSESGLLEEILSYGEYIAEEIVSRMDDGWKDYLLRQDNLPTLAQFDASKFNESMIRQCRAEYTDENGPIYEEFKSNILECVQKTGEKLGREVDAANAISALQHCIEVTGNVFEAAYCILSDAPGTVGKYRVEGLVRYKGAIINDFIEKVRAAAFEGGECALLHVMKARKAFAAVDQKIIHCIETEENKISGTRPLWPAGWRDDPRANVPRTHGPRLSYPRPDGPGGPGGDYF